MLAAGLFQHFIPRLLQPQMINRLLQPRLKVLVRPRLAVDKRRPAAPNESLCCRNVAAVQINRRNQRLADVAQHVFAGSNAHIPRNDIFVRAKTSHNLRHRFLAHQTNKPLRQAALRLIGKRAAQHIRHRNAQNPVAQKFQPLVIFMDVRRKARMRQRLLQQFRRLKGITDFFFQFLHILFFFCL